MAYITLSNAKSIIFKTELNSLNLIGDIYKKQIYFFSKFEKNRLLAFQELFRDPQKFFTEVYKPIRVIDTHTLVYEGNPPAYHKSVECPRIYTDYENFEIPEAIYAKGIKVVDEFRKWFKHNKHLLDKPDAFVFKLELIWGIKTNPKAIYLQNSGSTEVDNYNISELEKIIDDIIIEAGKIYNKNDRNRSILRRFNRYTFLGKSKVPINNNDTGFTDEIVKPLLNEYEVLIKKPIKKFLIEYYRLTLNPNIKLEGNLLEQLGFKTCGLCCNNKPFVDKLN